MNSCPEHTSECISSASDDLTPGSRKPRTPKPCPVARSRGLQRACRQCRQASACGKDCLQSSIILLAALASASGAAIGVRTPLALRYLRHRPGRPTPIPLRDGVAQLLTLLPGREPMPQHWRCWKLPSETGTFTQQPHFATREPRTHKTLGLQKLRSRETAGQRDSSGAVFLLFC